MNIKQIGLSFMIVLFLFGCKLEPEKKEPEKVDPKTILLTVGSSKDITHMLDAEMSAPITWSSGTPSKVTVSSSGIVTANITSFTTAEGGSKKYTEGPARAEVIITAKASDNKTQAFKVIATTEAQENIMDLPPLKDRFPENFLVGNIATSSNVGGSLTRHFNALTSENNMKPSYLSNNRNATTGEITYTWTTADNFVDAAIAGGFKVIGHTLTWHSQLPTWQTSMASATKEVALAAMKKFITEVVTHFKGKIYSWDVLNEAFPDSGAGTNWKTSIRTENPWFKSIGSDFVYEAFLAARLADPDAILYYNDYNTDQTSRAALIYNMVNDVNQKYQISGDKPDGEEPDRLLIEGIGMQEHHNNGVYASSIRAALNKFKPLGVKISVTEIDVIGYQSYSEYSTARNAGATNYATSTVTNTALLTQATRYQEYMAVYKDFPEIERITFWGVTDNQSWRSSGLPLLFDHKGKAKPAYYKFVGAIPTP